MINIFTQWKDDFSTGIDWQDAEHKHFLEQFGKLEHFICIADYSSVIINIKKSLTFLDEYINAHFDKEEEEMKRYGYPFLDQHKQAHTDFINDLYSIKDELNGKDYNQEEFFFYCYNLISWFYDHLKNEDIQFGKFIMDYNLT